MRYHHTSYAPTQSQAPKPTMPRTTRMTVDRAVSTLLDALDAPGADLDSPWPALLVDAQGHVAILVDADATPVPITPSEREAPGQAATLASLKALDAALAHTPHAHVARALWRDYGAFLTTDLGAFVGAFALGQPEPPASPSVEPKRIIRGPGRVVSVFQGTKRTTLALAWTPEGGDPPAGGPRVRWL